MPFQLKEYLDLARFLIAATHNVSTDAARRCAVSRAYYAAFCHARNYARDLFDFDPKNGAEDHKDLIACCREVKPEIADWLDRLRQWRNMCDYRDDVRGLDRMPQLAIVSAEKVFQDLP